MAVGGVLQSRLGLMGFESMKDLIETLLGAGLGALELFSMGLKALGAYVCRTLSYEVLDGEFDKTFDNRSLGSRLVNQSLACLSLRVSCR